MKKWMINHQGNLKACNKIVSAMQPYIDYVMLCDDKPKEKYNVVTLSVNAEIDGIKILVSEADGENQSIDIVGQDEAHLFYATCDFQNIYIPYVKTSTPLLRRRKYPKIFNEPLLKFDHQVMPKIEQRGIWLWGHTISDYRRFIENMADLKMNTLIIWNDYVPTNIDDVITFAHENYIKVYLGYAWGWDTIMPDKLDDAYIEGIVEKSLNTHREQYKNINCDGIYFQTITEHKNEILSGQSVAKVVVDMVNRIGSEILKEQPELKILFGLHATSVLNNLEEIAEVDNRISIIWENVGAFPWNYFPSKTNEYGDQVNFESTLQTTRQIRDLRENGGFGAVLKGYIWIDWTKFKHHEGPCPIGVSGRKYITDSENDRRSFERYFQAVWLKHAPQAHKLIKEFNFDSLVTVLVEDAYFEEKINFPTALYAELLWDYDRDITDILYQVALNPNVDFA